MEDRNIMKAIQSRLFYKMKSENRDINVLEQAKTPQFNRLDDIGTPLRLFESFFVNMLVHMIAGYTKLYGYREKADTSLENFS